METFKAAKRTTLTEDIYGQIIEAIREGRLKAGMKLPSERTLMHEFGASRASIREALRALAQAHVIEVRQGSGAYINGASADSVMNYAALSMLLERESIDELQQAREVVEVGAAKIAALRATQHNLEALAECVAEMESAADSGETARFTQADLSYHRTLASATQNPVMVNMLYAFHHLLVRTLERANRDPATLRSSAQRHRAIYDAIRCRDAAGAARLMEEKLAISSRFIADSFDASEAAPGHAANAEEKER